MSFFFFYILFNNYLYDQRLRETYETRRNNGKFVRLFKLSAEGPGICIVPRGSGSRHPVKSDSDTVIRHCNF